MLGDIGIARCAVRKAGSRLILWPGIGVAFQRNLRGDAEHQTSPTIGYYYMPRAMRPDHLPSTVGSASPAVGVGGVRLRSPRAEPCSSQRPTRRLPAPPPRGHHGRSTSWELHGPPLPPALSRVAHGRTPSSRRTIATPVTRAWSFPRLTARDRYFMPQSGESCNRSGGR